MPPDKQKTRPDNSSYDHKHAERLDARADETDPIPSRSFASPLKTVDLPSQ
jgi:hypothetical protein